MASIYGTNDDDVRVGTIFDDSIFGGPAFPDGRLGSGPRQ